MSTLKAVIYTDGSANPNPGFAGWGNYGYTYTHSTPCAKPKDTKGLKVNKEIVRTGADKFAEPEQLDVWRAWGPLEGNKRSNNEAEIKAAAEAIRYATANDFKQLEIRSDSMYTIDGATKWMANWINRGWKKADGTTVPNKDTWLELHQAITEATPVLGDVKWTWVKGHAGNHGNEQADNAAARGGILAKAEKYESVHEFIQVAEKVIENGEVKKAEKPKKPKKDKVPPYSRLLMHARWYFNTNVETPMSQDGRYIYTLGHHGEDELWGKRISDSCHSVVFLKNPDPVMESIRNKQNELGDEYIHPVVARMDTIRSAKNYESFFREGATYLTTDRTGNNLFTLASGVSKDDSDEDGLKNLITHKANPPRLAFIAMETLESLTDKLEDYLLGEKAVKVTTTDVTDKFYEFDTDKKGKLKYKPSNDMVHNAKSITPEVAWKTSDRSGTKTVVLTVGLDAPTKNMLSALAKLEPTIKVITWAESKKTIRFAVVVEAGDDCALFAAGHSNLCLV